MRRIDAVLLPLLLAVACHHEAAPAVCATPAAAAQPAPITDGMIGVGGGLSMHVHCMGEGTPMVVMDAGFGVSGTGWQLVQPDISRFTRVCVYDRLGSGYSDTPPKPHTVAQIVEQLHTLLSKAHLAGPYVLVGHSLGGLNVRRYAAAYPGDVAGMVLVDASCADQDQKLWSYLPAQAIEEMRDQLRSSREGVTLEDYEQTMAFLRGDHGLGAAPLVVLTAGLPDEDEPVPPEVRTKMSAAWQEMQRDLVKISTNSVQVVAKKSHHFVMMDQPALVTAAIREAVDAVRTHGKVDASRLAPLAE